MIAAAALLVLLCGVAVGATSIGGVLVVPVLTALADVQPARAVAAASFGFAFSGAAAVLAAGARAAPRTRGALLLDAGALAGAALGALTLTWLPAGGVRVAVGTLAVASGVYALLGRQRSAATALPGAARAALGLLVGCASAWSGTGGPVVLLPLLALLGWPADAAVQAAQRIQLPVAVAATAVNFAAGRLDVLLGLGIGAVVLAGWGIGRWLAARVPVQRMRQLLAVALIAVGLSYL